MKEKMMAAYCRGKLALYEAAENFFSEEKGASDIVAIVVIIVIVLAVAGIFGKELKGFVTKTMGDLSNFKI